MTRRVRQLYIKKNKKAIRWYFLQHGISCLLITEKFLFWIFWRWIIWYFWAKKLMEIWHVLITEKVLFWTFRWWEIRYFFQPKNWWKDDIYLAFLSFPWNSRTWEKWFFAQCSFPTIMCELSKFWLRHHLSIQL